MEIEALSNSNIHLVNKIDSGFTVDSKLLLNFSDNKFVYEIKSVTPYEKSYEYSETNYSHYTNDNNKTIFFSFENGNLSGQIILQKNWNNYAYISDIRIHKDYRVKGIGKLLMQKAIEWAKAAGCIGVEAETQDVNVAASLFYEKLGFKLGGVDMYKYKAFEKTANEFALNWYLIF